LLALKKGEESEKERERERESETILCLHSIFSTNNQTTTTEASKGRKMGKENL